MKLLKPTVIVLVGVVSVLMIANMATAASQGKGGKGGEAAVGINNVNLINPPNPNGDITAEISGGGFLGDEGGSVEVTLDGIALDHTVFSAELIVAGIPSDTADGEHEITVRTGDDNNQIASTMIRLGGEMVVSCISWFVSGPNDEHLHSEIHVEDDDGNAVIGATVSWNAGNDSTGIYQENTSATHDNDGHAHELTTCPLDENDEPDVSGSGVTDWFCCIGAGKWDNEVPPGKRACNPGEYTATVLNVIPPPFTNMVWDSRNSELSVTTELETKFP